MALTRIALDDASAYALKRVGGFLSGDARVAA